MAFTPEKDLKIFSNRLEILKKNNHIPADLIALVQTVHTRQIQARSEANVTIPDADSLASPDIHFQGAAILARDAFPYDNKQAEGLFAEFMDLLKDTPAPLCEAAKVTAEAIASGELLMADAFTAYLKADEEFFDKWAEKTPEAPRTLTFLVQSALSPSIAAAADQLADKHDAALVWNFDHCPICGSLPLIGELREKEGYRHMSCSFCQSGYRVQRMACVFCGEKDAEKLSYFKADEELGYRVDVCETCKLYIKSTDFRMMDRKAYPLLDDLESLALDILAGNEGYARPTLSGLGF